MEITDETSPQELYSFLKYVTAGKVTDNCTKTDRVVSSIDQDICRAVTNGKWKMPKHILLCMALRQMYRSKQLTTLLNRLGHCESHSLSLELETAIAKAVQESSSLLTSQIIRQPKVPSVFLSEFDNFDQLINTLTGMNSVHSAHGIMMQAINNSESLGHGGTVPDMPSTRRSTERVFKLAAEENLPECYIAQHKNPSYVIKYRLFPGCEGSVMTSREKGMLWIF